jgi:uncharacterized protein YndB with AHSA1/START domain
MAGAVWFALRKEDLGFVARAPVVHVAEAVVAAPRAAVFAALADAAGWPAWFPNVRTAAWTSRPPHGVGTTREATVGGSRWVEQMIAWDVDRRLAWTVTRATLPLAKALVESYEVDDAPGGTRLRWTFALEPRLLARLGAPFAGRTITRLLDRVAANLGAYLARPAA